MGWFWLSTLVIVGWAILLALLTSVSAELLRRPHVAKIDQPEHDDHGAERRQHPAG